jgi:hypothetical protein
LEGKEKSERMNRPKNETKNIKVVGPQLGAFGALFQSS